MSSVTVDNGTLPDYDVAVDVVGVNGAPAAPVQFVKLVDGTDNGTNGIPGDATNGLDVDVTRVVPGTGGTSLGKAEDAAHADGHTGVMLLGVRNYTGPNADGDYSALSTNSSGELRVVTHRDLVRVAVDSAGLTTTTPSYAAGDQVGTLFTLPGMARVTGGSGLIVGVGLIDASDVIGAYDVLFFRASVTLAADNAAFSISDADALNIVALVQLAGAWDLGQNRLAQALNLSIPYDCSGGTSLFAALITRSAHGVFGAANALRLVVWAERN